MLDLVRTVWSYVGDYFYCKILRVGCGEGDVLEIIEACFAGLDVDADVNAFIVIVVTFLSFFPKI